MGISVELFRMRIGNFNKVKEISKMKLRSNHVLKLNVRNCRIQMSVLLVCSLLLLSLNCHKSLNYCTGVESKLTPKNVEIGRGKIAFYSWAQTGLSINKLQKIINGNRRAVGYKLAVWNCGRGLVQEGCSTKLNEITDFLHNKKPHCLGVIESDLFSHQSQTTRAKYSTADLKEILKVDGYKIELPTSWEVHGQARLICYVSEEVNCRRKYLTASYHHLPTITLEIGLGRATTTTVHYYYREWKNGVTGESNSTSQLNHIR